MALGLIPAFRSFNTTLRSDHSPRVMGVTCSMRDVYKRQMLDMDLAKIYGYSTKDFNRQVKNNIEKFEQDFMFQLSDEELSLIHI